MSDRLPPPSYIPKRFSQTVLGKGEDCMRSAYLALDTPRVSSHAMDFGTAAHLFAEQMILELVRRGEPTLYAQAEGEDPVHAKREVASLTAAMVDAILREHPELQVPALGEHGADALREVAYHLAIGQDVRPDDVVGVEWKFLLELPSGRVSGKIDLASMPESTVAQVDDYKTTYNPVSQARFEEVFQTKLYAAALLFGRPLVKKTEVCPACDGSTFFQGMTAAQGATDPCPECHGTGELSTEVELDPLPMQYVTHVRGREVYPRYLRDDGTLRSVHKTWTRAELADFLTDVDRRVAAVREALDTGDWPATPGSWCSMCPARVRCPLPAELRRWAGAIETREQALEAMAWVMVQAPRIAATKKEVRGFLTTEELRGLVVGDRVWELTPEESWSTKWPELEEGIHRAVVFGEPFELGEYRRRQESTRFKERAALPDEMGAEAPEEVEGNGGVPAVPTPDFGEDPPF